MQPHILANLSVYHSIFPFSSPLAWALFVLFLSTLVCCQPIELIWVFFLFHKFSNFTPPPPKVVVGVPESVTLHARIACRLALDFADSVKTINGPTEPVRSCVFFLKSYSNATFLYFISILYITQRASPWSVSTFIKIHRDI